MNDNTTEGAMGFYQQRAMQVWGQSQLAHQLQQQTQAQGLAGLGAYLGTMQLTGVVTTSSNTITSGSTPGPEDEKAWLRRRVKEVLWPPR